MIASRRPAEDRRARLRRCASRRGGGGFGGGDTGGLLRSVVFGAALVWLGSGGGLRAELQWQEPLIRLEPPIGAAEATGEFVFLNRGTSAIRVVDVRSSCDCTAMVGEKSVVLPGEKGRVPFVYHIGSRQGRQAVTVSVTTNEPEIRNYELTVEVAIKDFAVLTPRALHWQVGDEASGKTLQVNLAADFRFVGAESASPDFAVNVAGTTDGAVRLRVTPRDTWAKRSGLIKVKVAQGRQSPVEMLAQVRVQ